MGFPYSCRALHGFVGLLEGFRGDAVHRSWCLAGGYRDGASVEDLFVG